MRFVIIALFSFWVGIASAEFRAINDPEDGWLNIRSGPGTNHLVVNSLENGASVRILAKVGNWVKIEYLFGDTGWAYLPYTESENSFFKRHKGKYDVTSLGRLARFCYQPYLSAAFDTQNGQDFCLGTYYCGDGGCDAIDIAVAVRPGKDADLFSLASNLRVTKIGECKWDVFGDGTKAYCLKSVPGYEIENSLRLRGRTDITSYVRRTGGGAGAPPRMIQISESQFQRFRGSGISELRAEVIKALERATGKQCVTTHDHTCSVTSKSGRIAIDLLAVGTHITGRTDHWEKSYWELFVHWDGSADEYQLSVNLPVTSIKRWPTSGPKPSNGFKPLDFDDRFEKFRTFLMEQIAYSIDASLTEDH